MFSCPAAADCGSTTYAGKAYRVLQWHFHTPSENTVNGVHYAGEMHVVHQADDGALLVVAKLFEGKTAPAPPTPASAELSSAWASLAATAGATDGAVDLGAIVGSGGGFWQWTGSLTTPPCTEGLVWLLAREPATVAPALLNAFWAHIGGHPGNARPVQSLNGRAITKIVD